MMPLIQEITTDCSPELLAEKVRGRAGLVVLRSALFGSEHARYSFVSACPFLTLRSQRGCCEIRSSLGSQTRQDNPWDVMESLMNRFALSRQPDVPFPLGGCFGFWGYDLKHFVEPRLPRRTPTDLDWPECHLGFYPSLVVFDHQLGKTSIVATGLTQDGSRCPIRAGKQLEFWRKRLEHQPTSKGPSGCSHEQTVAVPVAIESNFSRPEFLALVHRAQRYIRSGDIYQVNLSQRFSASLPFSSWQLFHRLTAVSPAPFAAFLDCGNFQIVSSSPELFLCLSGSHVQTRPIKGTRPRAADPTRDAQLAYELQTSPKESAELVMITDLLRNDLGRVCEYGSVQVSELSRLERYPQVQHLVSTVEGRLRRELSHVKALAACFPGGSVTGAPKVRAMEIIDELESVARGPYTGALGYLGFNRESQLSILIRTAVCTPQVVYFHVGAGIVADSQPAAEYDETLAKARGFFEALSWQPQRQAQPASRTDP